MENLQSLPWMEPLGLAAHIDQPVWMLLYSAVQTTYSGRYSYLACNLAERIEADDFIPLQQKLRHNQSRFENAWFGYLGYGLKNALEELAQDTPTGYRLPNLCMLRFHTIYLFDHEQKTLRVWSPKQPSLPKSPNPKEIPIPAAGMIQSNMTQQEYLEKAAQIIEHIHEGDLYQANLTRKFAGQFSSKPNPFAIFKKLCEVSPAPYSAYLQIDGISILSSSPERFLNISAGEVTTRPIKGTSPRFPDAKRDDASRQWLASSPKDQAENLMIVDLMRSDLAKCCIPGSITVPQLFEITSHATIHHMSSTVTGQKLGDVPTLEVIKSCFPPGSMTGAPKITAMNLCSALEKIARGVYSGALGWFGGDGSCDLSVVIRTLIIEGDHFEFQVGGGITAGSTPQKELEEIFQKSAGIAKALGLDLNQLRNI